MADETLNALIELAVTQAAPAHQADPAALLDSEQFVSALRGLEPGAPGFTGRVSAAVKAAAEADARFRAAAPEGGGAGTQPPAQWTRDDVKRHSPDEVTKAIDDGLLRDLGYPPRRRGGAA